MRTACIGLACLALAAVSACGGNDDPARSVRFERVLLGAYIEGSAWSLRVTHHSAVGAVDVAELTLIGQDSISLRLNRGRYTVSSAQRACDGTCRQLDAASERCAATLSVDEGTKAIVTTVRAGKGCTISKRT